MKKSSLFLLFLTLLVMGLLRYQARQELWFKHLWIDSAVYHERVVAYLRNHSWSEIPGNEYQPGALWWLAFSGLFPLDGEKYDGFFTAFMACNFFLLGLHVLLARNCGPPSSPWVMLALAAAAGPILLFRFELFVSLLVLLGWVCWRNARWACAGLFLGLAAASKIYPLLLLPPMVLQALRVKGFFAGLRALMGFLSGIALMVVPFLFSGGSVAGIRDALLFHKDKPVGLDGLLGSILPLIQDRLDLPLRIASRNNIHGFETDIPCLAGAASWLWAPFYLLVLILLICRLPKQKYCEPGALFLLVLSFLSFQKVNNPQYFWWGVVFLPFVSGTWFPVMRRSAAVVFSFLILALGQIVYPMFYSEFLDSFYGGSLLASPLFLVNLVRNVFWLLLLVVGIAPFFSQGIRGTPQTS